MNTRHELREVWARQKVLESWQENVLGSAETRSWSDNHGWTNAQMPTNADRLPMFVCLCTKWTSSASNGTDASTGMCTVWIYIIIAKRGKPNFFCYGRNVRCIVVVAATGNHSTVVTTAAGNRFMIVGVAAGTSNVVAVVLISEEGLRYMDLLNLSLSINNSTRAHTWIELGYWT